jgi:hypothetical protein
MKTQTIASIILTAIIVSAFSACSEMTLFHGEKPEPPPVTYTVTFNANGAGGTPPAAQTLQTGAVLSLPDKGGLSKGADIFAGWGESASGGTIYSIWGFHCRYQRHGFLRPMA